MEEVHVWQIVEECQRGRAAWPEWHKQWESSALGLPHNAETSMYACSNDDRFMGRITLVPTGTSTPSAMWLVIMYVHRLFFSPRQPYLTAMQPFSAIWTGY